MPLFGRQKPVGPSDDELRAAEVDLERIRQGGIPLGAEERLKRVGSAKTPFFTSDLSAKEFALAQVGGLQPVAQVMGSSVVQHGWYGQRGGYYWTTGEVPGLSEPWNIARNRAFSRMQQEATLAAADGVIGVEIGGGTLADPGNVELVVFGTAVRDTAFERGDGPLGMCTLSGQEVDKLRRIGAQVCGVVGHTSVIAVQLSPNSNWLMRSGGFGAAGGWGVNAEIPEISHGVYSARRVAMDAVRQQANAVGANNLVISTLRHSIEHREYEQVGFTHHYFYVTMNILGTAIRLGAREPYPQPLSSPMMSINLGAP